MMEEDEKVSSYSRLQTSLTHPNCYPQFREYLEQHGYDTSQLGLKDVIDPETGSVHSEKDIAEKKAPVDDFKEGDNEH